MKKIIITILIIMLAISSCGNFVSAETEMQTSLESENNENLNNETKSRNGQTIKNNTTVTAQETGYANITFSDGYRGYCINKDKYSAVKHEKFTVKNTTSAVNSISKEPIGNYLKIMFVEYHDNITQNKMDTQNLIWTFTNYDYASSSHPIIQGVLALANQGLVIPDHGYTKEISNEKKATFDFEVLDSNNNIFQNFFGFKIAYSNITQDIVNETEPENDTDEIPGGENEEPAQPDENLTQSPDENQTILENNETIPENETPKENITEIIPEIGENKTEEIIQPVENTSQDEIKEVNLLEYKTGHEAYMTLILAAILVGLLYLHFRRDY